MKKKSLIVCILLFSHHQVTPLDGFIGKAIQTTVDAATSDFAISVYRHTCVTVATATVITLIEPALAKYRITTGTENISEINARAQLREKFIQLDEIDFQVQLGKMDRLGESFERYQQLMQKRIQNIKEGNSSDEEKQTLLSEIELRIKKTEEKLLKYNTSQFEKLVNDSSERIKDSLLNQAKNS